MPTLTFPLSRIEGHARVVIEVWRGEVKAAYFQATEIRGFQQFVRGTPAEQMPLIMPRVCGVCSTAHHVAAVKALEDAYDVSPPPMARALRELLLLGQLIQNQATSLFLFTLPDRIGEGTPSLFDAAKDAVSDDGDEQQMRDLARRALRVRKAGTDLITLAGGQFIHPIKTVVGGMISGIPEADAVAFRAELNEMLPVACGLVDFYIEQSMALRDRIGTWGDDQPAYYISSGEAERFNLDSDQVHVMGPAGERLQSFCASEFLQHITLDYPAYSFAGQSSYNGEVMRANSLARVNIEDQFGTPAADLYLMAFRREFGRPAHAILFFDLARCIELVYSIERAMHILEQPLDGDENQVSYTPKDGEGFGLVEAPRGPLIHHYCIENGLIANIDLIIPTVHNMLAIERALRVVAERYISPDGVNMELEKAVGRVVRAFDPCIACASH